MTFQAEETEIFGVSADAKGSHQSFAQKNELPYLLLMDERRVLRKLWKVPKTLMVLDGRVSYVIDKKGVCRFVYSSAAKPTEHIKQCLKNLKTL
jgi:peroxiredoxin Q/BCP